MAFFSAQRGLDGASRLLDEMWTDGTLSHPMLREAVVSSDCSLVGTHDYRTHTIIIGKVASINYRSDAQAMLYLDGCFASVMRHA